MFVTHADFIEASNCIILNSTLGILQANYCFLYNVLENEPLSLKDETVRADVHLDNEIIPLYTQLNRDGKNDWSDIIPLNSISYEEMHQHLLSLKS